MVQSGQLRAQLVEVVGAAHEEGPRAGGVDITGQGLIIIADTLELSHGSAAGGADLAAILALRPDHT